MRGWESAHFVNVSFQQFAPGPSVLRGGKFKRPQDTDIDFSLRAIAFVHETRSDNRKREPNMSFQIHGLPRESFVDLFLLSEEQLAGRSARRIVVDAKPGFPCRISLVDADIGESVVLVNYTHQPNKTPYRASHAIFVREAAKEAAARLAGEGLPGVVASSEV